MATVTTLLALSALAAPGFPQLPRLSPATAVDVRVKSIQWHPRGEAVLYNREEGKGGQGVGVFMPSQPEGKVLLHLAPGDSCESQWFEGTPVAISIVYHPVLDTSETEISIHLLDAKAGAARRIFLRRFAKDQKADVDVDPSPSLMHAIFRLRDVSGRTHLVLPPGGGNLIGSPDLDEAARQGLQGPVWSVDGTANYAKMDIAAARIALEPKGNQAAQKEEDVTALHLTETLLSYRLSLGNLLPAPEVGAATMELVPGNGILRPVRFRGKWTPAPTPTPLAEVSVPAVLEFGTSRGNGNSLWLIRSEKKKDQGVLIAADASKGWVSPENKAVAYLTNGALFVRTMQK